MRFNTAAVATLTALAAPAWAAARPNIIVVLTDDQDAQMNSIDYMPLLQKHLVDQGTTFTKHYCTIAICCPSRVNLWTGQLAHNTNVTDVSPPYGGYPKFVAEGYSDRHLAVWMQESGYNTYYVGKLFNHHSVGNYDKPHVRGFTGSDFLLDPTTYQYWNFSTTHNGAPPVRHDGVYSPDFTAERVYEFLAEAAGDSEKPFFLVAAPIAPHGNFQLAPKLEAGPPQAAPRHQHLFGDYEIPRTPNFNPETPSGVDWIARLPRLDDTVLAYNDEFQRQRLRSLQAVDEMVEGIVARLEASGQLDNTYIFYTADNGYHISQHRLNPGKECSFETDINVPLLVRGPGVPAGLVKDSVVSSHTDLAPTVMHLAGNPLRADFDGQPIAVHAASNTGPEHVGTEFWGHAFPEGKYGSYVAAAGHLEAYYGLSPADYEADTQAAGPAPVNNTYKGLRVVSAEYNLYYTVWCTNDRQLYDMSKDPFQVDNLLDPKKTAATAGPASTLLGRDLATVADRLDALMLIMKSCKGNACVEPWRRIHPRGDVHSLSAALAPKYDAFYAQQPKVSFTSCKPGYLREVEGPQHARVFGGGALDTMREQVPIVDPNWSLWT